MTLTITPMNAADARAILAWRYAGPYAVYNLPDAALGSDFDYVAELTDTRSPHFAAREPGQADAEPIGFFGYGSACEVGGDGAEEVSAPYALRPDGSATIGLGLRPDLTGHGRGLELVETTLTVARQRYQPSYFRLYVFEWNQRAIRVYERAGFQRVGVTRLQAPEGERVFIEMTRQP